MNGFSTNRHDSTVIGTETAIRIGSRTSQPQVGCPSVMYEATAVCHRYRP